MEQPPVEWAGPRAPVTVEHRTLPAADGYPLAVTFFRPDESGDGHRKVAILVSSLGGDRRHYVPFAGFLAHRGWTVLTFDCRGIGSSRNGRAPSQLTVDLVGWVERDVAAMVEWVRTHLAPDSLVGIGHSMGGQLLGLAPNNSELDALLLISSQTNHWRLRPTPWNLAVLAYVAAATVAILALGELPLWPTGPESAPAGVARQWRTWAFNPTYPDPQGRSLLGRFAALEAPVLSVSFSDDPFYAPPQAVAALLALFSRASTESWCFRPEDFGLAKIGHRGFFLPGLLPALWERVWLWLEAAGTAGGHDSAPAPPADGFHVDRVDSRLP